MNEAFVIKKRKAAPVLKWRLRSSIPIEPRLQDWHPVDNLFRLNFAVAVPQSIHPDIPHEARRPRSVIYNLANGRETLGNRNPTLRRTEAAIV